jgi:hypothetical protein
VARHDVVFGFPLVAAGLRRRPSRGEPTAQAKPEDPPQETSKAYDGHFMGSNTPTRRQGVPGKLD